MAGVVDRPVQYSTAGCNYGDISLINGKVIMKSSSEKPIFEMNLADVALCVVPVNNKDEIELQFVEKEDIRREDTLVQATFHFPTSEQKDEPTDAENFQRSIMDTGLIRSVTGNVIAEFSKEQGNFVTPRGKYSMQLSANYLHMQGAQYAYKIQYDDINSLFLLPKPDGGRMAFVISLEKPIRQGNQKYQNLVLETHKLEHTMDINLTEEEIRTQYEDQLATQMTMPLSSLIAKVFKVLSRKKVFIPKQFVSSRDAHAVRCSLKANEGLLYPLAKSFIFINKPTVIVKFEDVEGVEFKRLEASAGFSTRNFDLVVTVKAAAGLDGRELTFLSIDRAEYPFLFDYLKSKDIAIENPMDAGTAAGMGKGVVSGLMKGIAADEQQQEQDEGSEGEEGESEDGDYRSGASSSHSDDSDGESEGQSEGGDNNSEGSGGGQGKKKKEQKEKREKKEKKTADGKKRKREESSGKETNGKASAKDKKGKKPKKDKNAPKGASSSYIIFSTQERSKVKSEKPEMSVTEISKEIGARWNALSAEEKAPFEDLARKDKLRYKDEMQTYQETKAAQADAAQQDEEGEGGEGEDEPADSDIKDEE